MSWREVEQRARYQYAVQSAGGREAWRNLSESHRAGWLAWAEPYARAVLDAAGPSAADCTDRDARSERGVPALWADMFNRAWDAEHIIRGFDLRHLRGDREFRMLWWRARSVTSQLTEEVRKRR